MEDRTHLLKPHRVVVHSNTEGVCFYKFQAETVPHALEQFFDAKMHSEQDIENIYCEVEN